tara:strand:+ start:79 stop:372 length:294 start_codon:yes stop_codon:yes gene_type:complete
MLSASFIVCLFFMTTSTPIKRINKIDLDPEIENHSPLDDYSLSIVIPLSKKIFLSELAGDADTEEEYKKWAYQTAKECINFIESNFWRSTATLNKPL